MPLCQDVSSCCLAWSSDNDECVLGEASCVAGTHCKNTPGSYKCAGENGRWKGCGYLIVLLPYHIQLCIHTYIHTYIHTFIHTYMHAYIHTHTYMHAYIHTYIHAYIHTHIHTFTHTRTHTHTHTHTHTLVACHVTCLFTCTGPGPNGCVECKKGYMKEIDTCVGTCGGTEEWQPLPPMSYATISPTMFLHITPYCHTTLSPYTVPPYTTSHTHTFTLHTVTPHSHTLTTHLSHHTHHTSHHTFTPHTFTPHCHTHTQT